MAKLTLSQALQLGDSHREAGRFAEAAAIYQRVLQVDPRNSIALYWLGDLATKADDLPAAIDFFSRAADVSPKWLQPRCRLGFVLLDEQCIPEAMAAFRASIEIAPNDGVAHYGLSWALLATGDFAAGWAEHEWRLRCDNLPGKARPFPGPPWDGSELNGRTLLLYQEQGAGDVIQMVRYVPMVIKRGARVLLGCSPELESLLMRDTGVAEVAPSPDNIPRFDTHLPMHSLPAVFQTKLETIPADMPYLHPDPTKVDQWSARIDRTDGRLQVGLCWAGSAKHENDRLRSIPLSAFAPLAEIDGVRFHSLQKGDGAEQAKDPPPGMDLADWSAELHDFDETAAAIANLDLVISVDTSVAHLAGALARPVWNLVTFRADWRWLLDRRDSPWYPTMRLFRQPARHDWNTVLQHVERELRELH